MPMNMPTLADLQDLYGAGSVSALQQAEQQQGLARQYAQQEVQQAQNKTQEGTLKNLFDAEQNPQLIQQRGLENIGLGNKNITEGVDARRAAANEGMQLSEDQRKFALTATQQDLDMADKWAEGEIRSGDPQRMQEARKILDFSSAARTAKALADAAMERQKEQSRASKYSADSSAAASRYGADTRAAAAKARQTTNTSVEEKIAGAKTLQHKSNIYDAAANKARLDGDDEMARYYSQKSLGALQEDIAARGASAQVGAAQQLNLGALQEGRLERQGGPVGAPTAPPPRALPPGWTIK